MTEFLFLLTLTHLYLLKRSIKLNAEATSPGTVMFTISLNSIFSSFLAFSKIITFFIPIILV